MGGGSGEIESSPGSTAINTADSMLFQFFRLLQLGELFLLQVGLAVLTLGLISLSC